MYFNQKLSTVQIGEIYGVTKSAIGNHLRKWGYHLRQVGVDRANCLYDVNVNFFNNINTENKAYTLGFFLADGHISKQGVLMFTIHKKDLDVLEKINNALDSTYEIKPVKDKYVSLCIKSKEIESDLINMGFNHRKTYGFDFQNVIDHVPTHLYVHFIRGMFDGDGGIGYYKYPYVKKHQFSLEYTGLFEPVNFVKEYFGLKTKLVQETDIIYTCTTKCIDDIIKIRKILYNDATIYMNRKFEIFNEIERIYDIEFSQ